MEVEAVESPGDAGDPDLGDGAALRRYNSAPMINNIGREGSPLSLASDGKSRRNSGGFLSRQGTATPPSPGRVMSSRVNQIKQLINRETAHERETRAALHISQSCEDLSLSEALPELEKTITQRRSDFFPLSPSPSPTRGIGKQLYSPSLQAPVSPSRAPSPRRFTTKRSASPISHIRPSTLGSLKRKARHPPDFEVDHTSKRLFLGTGDLEFNFTSSMLNQRSEFTCTLTRTHGSFLSPCSSSDCRPSPATSPHVDTPSPAPSPAHAPLSLAALSPD
uniref:Family with sequence similarity 122B n=1 Tax=Petromyzon marinus TaxID=7757 RepID=S4RXS0_PETMA